MPQEKLNFTLRHGKLLFIYRGTETHFPVVNIPASYSVGPGLKSGSDTAYSDRSFVITNNYKLCTIMKSSIFLNTPSCSQLKVNQTASSALLTSSLWFLAWLILRHWRCSHRFLQSSVDFLIFIWLTFYVENYNTTRQNFENISWASVKPGNIIYKLNTTINCITDDL
jgi:hypothetical protein